MTHRPGHSGSDIQARATPKDLTKLGGIKQSLEIGLFVALFHDSQLFSYFVLSGLRSWDNLLLRLSKGAAAHGRK
ncbi:MAG: hypothetical protein ACJAXQ_000444 [Parvibaculaceae bacterium]|jgi:hypothetical protein